MALYKLHDFDPSYRDSFEGDDVKGLDVYSEGSDEKIGSIYDALIDEDGTFRYLIVDTGFWVFGKKVLLPIGQARIDYSNKRAYARLTKEQVQNLPEFTDDLKLDYDYEEQVRGVYRPSISSTADASMPMDASYVTPGMTSVDTSLASAGTTPVDATGYVDDATTYDRDTYNYDRDAGLFGTNDRDHQQIRLYEERLRANKNRTKTGEVAVGKRVETETQHVSVPIEKERVVIERTNVAGMGTAVTPGTVDFQDGEVARVEVYEEVADIQKEAFVREEVQVRKEIDHETVESDETIRREELDVNTQGTPIVDRRNP
jgi:uncharacterized protein (TIGR02271 family)